MSFIKNIKSLFVVEGGSSSNKDEKNVTSTAKTTSKQKTVQVKESAAGKAGKVSSKFSEVLFKAMEKNNLDGIDYLEYKQSLRSLAKMPMDEATRYQSAFAMAQTMGATPQKLVQTAEHYVNILQQEESKFAQALSNQKKTQIGNREEEVKKLQQVIEQKAAQIKKLSVEIEQHQKQRTTLAKEIETAVVKVETTKNDFIASFNALVAQIQNDITNMKKYLK